MIEVQVIDGRLGGTPPRRPEDEFGCFRGKGRAMATMGDYVAAILARRDNVEAFRLRILLYYAQAWAVAWTGRPAFRERVEAWREGPVIPDLQCACNGAAGEGHRASGIPGGSAAALDVRESDVVDSVLAAYGDCDHADLTSELREHSPWRETRGGLPDSEPFNAVIGWEAMRNHHRRQEIRGVGMVPARPEWLPSWREELARSLPGAWAGTLWRLADR